MQKSVRIRICLGHSDIRVLILHIDMNPTTMNQHCYDANTTVDWWQSSMCDYSITLLAMLSTPEAKSEKPAWYENILQTINVLQISVYKCQYVNLIPFNKMWAQEGCWTVLVDRYEQGRSMTNSWWSVHTILSYVMAEMIVSHNMIQWLHLI